MFSSLFIQQVLLFSPRDRNESSEIFQPKITQGYHANIVGLVVSRALKIFEENFKRICVQYLPIQKDKFSKIRFPNSSSRQGVSGFSSGWPNKCKPLCNPKISCDYVEVLRRSLVSLHCLLVTSTQIRNKF